VIKVFGQFARLLRLCNSGKGGKASLGYLAVVVALQLAGIYFAVRLVAWTSDFYGALEKVDAGAAVRQIIAINGRDNDVLQRQGRDRLGHAGGFADIDRARHAGAHVAERTGPRAGIAQNHEGGVLFRPALPDIRAGRFLAHRHQPVLTHDPSGFLIGRRSWGLDADP